MKTALLIDDSEYMRELIKKLIKSHDIEVIGEAENGKDGVAKYKELKPDIVFMDINMDEMNGLEALKQITDYDQDAKVIVASSVIGQQFVIEDAEAFGAKALLLKPPTVKKIAEVIDKVMGK